MNKHKNKFVFYQASENININRYIHPKKWKKEINELLN